MCKYGDFFLQLEIDEKYGVTNVVPLSVYDVSRIEDIAPDIPEYVKYLAQWVVEDKIDLADLIIAVEYIINVK